MHCLWRRCIAALYIALCTLHVTAATWFDNSQQMVSLVVCINASLSVFQKTRNDNREVLIRDIHPNRRTAQQMRTCKLFFKKFVNTILTVNQRGSSAYVGNTPVYASSGLPYGHESMYSTGSQNRQPGNGG